MVENKCGNIRTLRKVSRLSEIKHKIRYVKKSIIDYP